MARGTKVTLRLKVPKKVQKAIKQALRRRKRVRAAITVSAHDAACNTTSRKRSIKLKR